MARWDRKIEKALKIGRTELKEGMYVDMESFNRLVSWLHAQNFREPENNESKETGLFSPDYKWFFYFRPTNGFVFVQLKNFLRARLDM